jgi:uncharacterized protein
MHQPKAVEIEWDPNKAAGNLRKQGIRFAEAATVFEDDVMLTMADEDPNEERFVALGIGSMGSILVVIYTVRGDRIRIISARKATRREQSAYELKRQ